MYVITNQLNMEEYERWLNPANSDLIWNGGRKQTKSKARKSKARKSKARKSRSKKHSRSRRH